MIRDAYISSSARQGIYHSIKRSQQRHIMKVSPQSNSESRRRQQLLIGHNYIPLGFHFRPRLGPRPRRRRLQPAAEAGPQAKQAKQAEQAKNLETPGKATIRGLPRRSRLLRLPARSRHRTLLHREGGDCHLHPEGPHLGVHPQERREVPLHLRDAVRGCPGGGL